MQIAGEVSNLLVNVGIPSMIGLQCWVVKKIYSFESKFTRLDTWAFGPTGQNGVNGRVTKLETDVEDMRDKDRESR